MIFDRLALAGAFFGVVALFEFAWLVARRYPTSWAIPVVYGLGVTWAAGCTALFTIQAIRQPTVGGVLLAVAWLVALALLALLATVATRFMLMRRNLAARQMVPFTALLGPVDKPSDDGRMLLAGEWHVPERGGAPLFTVEPKRRSPTKQHLIGVVQRVWLADKSLMAAGLVMAGARLDGLQPEMVVEPRLDEAAQTLAGWPMTFEHDDGGQLLCVFPPGVVTSVRMGPQPAFPDVWLRVDREMS
jgi:hypothetical protein